MSTQNMQDEILAFIGEFIEEKGYPPTRRDIMNGCQISSTSVVQRHLGWLEKAGDIALDPGLSRGIRIPDAKLPAPS